MRVGRGVVLAAACLTLSLGAHVAAGGQVHLSSGLLFGGLLLSAMCVAAAQSQGGFAGIAATVVLSQPALHLLAGASTHAGDAAARVPDLLMVAFHAAAAIAVSVLLAGGDRVIWALAGLSQLPRIPAPMSAAVAPAVVDVPVAAPGFVPRHLVVAKAGVGRRGPPLS